MVVQIEVLFIVYVWHTVHTLYSLVQNNSLGSVVQLVHNITTIVPIKGILANSNVT
jgi:hypothetical protein